MLTILFNFRRKIKLKKILNFIQKLRYWIKPDLKISGLMSRVKVIDRMRENEIVRRCQEGDVSAYKVIYDRYGQLLLRTALRMLGQKQDAEDAVQVTFIRLYRGIKNFRYDSKFSAYLFRILLNVCLNQIAKKKKMKTQALNTVHLHHQPRPELRIQLEEAINHLPAQQKACFVLFAVEELSQDEIAAILGLSVGGVKSNIHHAKKKLRALLSDDSTEE